MLKKLFIIFGLVLTLVGCQKAEPFNADFSEFYAQKIIDAIKTDNYPMFSDNFSDVMKDAIPEEEFIKFANSIHEKLGHYQEMSFYSAEVIEENGVEYIVTLYKVVFEEDENTFLTVTFTQNEDEYIVEGLYINSNKLQ
jgi:hypothetical protein